MKSPDNIITATDNQRPFTNEVKSDEITGFSDVTDMTCQLPVIAEKRITFERIQFGVSITPAGQPLPTLRYTRILSHMSHICQTF